MARVGKLVKGRWETGFLVYSVPVGTDQYVEYMLNTKVNKIEELGNKACKVPEGEVQALWTILRMSIMQQFDYWLHLVHPIQLAKSAERVNGIVVKVLEKILG